MEKNLKLNVFWMFLGNSFYAFSQWIQLSLIAKHCTLVTLGTYTLALAISAPVFMFLGFQLRSLIVTDTKEEWRFSNYFMMRLIFMLVCLLIIIAYTLINETEFTILFLVATLKCIEGLAEIFNARQQLAEQMKYVARSLILKGLFATLSIFIGIYILDSLVLGLAMAVVTNSLILILNDYLNCRKLLQNEKIITLKDIRFKSLLIKALPLGIVMCIISLNTNVSKYMIEFSIGTEEQAVYSTITYCLVIGNFVNTAIGQSFTPRMSKYYADKKLTEFKNLLVKYLSVNIIIGFGLFAATFLGGGYFLKIMFSENIANYTTLFSLVMFSGVFLYIASALGYTLTSMRIFKIQPLINGIVLVVNIIGCFFLLKSYGIYGAVYSSILAFSIQSLVTFYFIKRNL